MVKLLLGMLKGLVIGAGVGYGAFALGLDGGLLWLVYGVIGSVVGLFVGRPVWSLLFDKNATSVVSILKAAFGFGVGVGLYALVAKVWGGAKIPVSFLGNADKQWEWLQNVQPVMGAAIGALYGGFVELDDSVDDSKAKAASKALPEPKADKKPAPKK